MDAVDGILKGLISGILPGVHPLVFRFNSDVSATVAHSLYSVLSVIPSVYLGAFSATTAYTAIVAHRLARKGLGLHAVYLYVFGALAGMLLSVLYMPLSHLLSLRAPRFLVFSVLVVASSLVIIRSRSVAGAALLAVFYSIYGFVVLDTPVPVRSPLPIAISGLFGASTVLVSLVSNDRFDVGSVRTIRNLYLLRGAIFGLLVSLIVAYFPALSLSVAAFFVQPLLSVKDEEMMVASGSAATSSLLFTAVGRGYGLVRSSFAATLSGTTDIRALLPVFISSVVLAATLAFLAVRLLHAIYSFRFVKILSILVVLAMAHYMSGLTGVLLAVSATAAGALTHVIGVEKRVAMFFILGPTLYYYAPI